MNNTRFRTIAQLFFALLMVVAQLQLLIHETEIEAHSEQTSCEYCVHFTQLGSGVLGEIDALALSPNSSSDLRLIYISASVSSACALPQTRAPPVSSLS